MQQYIVTLKVSFVLNVLKKIPRSINLNWIRHLLETIKNKKKINRTPIRDLGEFTLERRPECHESTKVILTSFTQPRQRFATFDLKCTNVGISEGQFN